MLGTEDLHRTACDEVCHEVASIGSAEIAAFVAKIATPSSPFLNSRNANSFT
jgi:hypothetical protein